MAMESLPRPPGASFAPEDGDLLALYLRRKIAGEPLPSTTAPYIHERDVYAADPAALVSGLLHASSVARNGRESGDEWYFYTSVQAKSSRDSRRCRAVAGGVGTWHSEKARQEVVDQEDDDRVIGYRQSFTYEPKNGWLMTEYTLVGQEGGRGEAMPVLCKIYRSPHAAPGRSASKSNSSMSGSKKRKAVVAEEERSGAGSSGRVRRRLQFPFPPAANPCALVAPAGSEILIPIEPQAEKKAEDGFLVPTEAQAEKKADDGFLVPIEAQAEKKAEEEFLVPSEGQAQKKAEDEFLLPTEAQTEKKAEESLGFETQQEPMASSRTLLISRLPMAVRRACAGALASLGLPFEEWATEDQIKSHDASRLMGGFISPYDATCEMNCSRLCSFPPSAHGIDTSTLPGMSCHGATTFLSDGAGAWATPPSAQGLPADSWTSIY